MILEKAFGSGPEKITYLETTSEGKFLIYLHGGFGSPDYINYLDARLTKNGFKIVAPYLPGHGKTFRLGKNYDYERFLKDVESFVLSFANKEEVVLIGRSFGGRLAWDIVSRNPVFFKHLVLISPLLDVEDIMTTLQIAKWGIIDKLGDKIRARLQGEYKKDSAAFKVAKNKRWDVYTIWSCIKTMGPLVGEIPLEVKVLFMLGKYDHEIRKSVYDRNFSKAKNSKLIEFNAGHYWHTVYPITF